MITKIIVSNHNNGFHNYDDGSNNNNNNNNNNKINKIITTLVTTTMIMMIQHLHLITNHVWRSGQSRELMMIEGCSKNRVEFLKQLLFSTLSFCVPVCACVRVCACVLLDDFFVTSLLKS